MSGQHKSYISTLQFTRSWRPSWPTSTTRRSVFSVHFSETLLEACMLKHSYNVWMGTNPTFPSFKRGWRPSWPSSTTRRSVFLEDIPWEPSPRGLAVQHPTPELQCLDKCLAQIRHFHPSRGAGGRAG